MIRFTQKWRDLYHARIAEIGYEPDPAQLTVIDELARIDHDLAHKPSATLTKKRGFFSAWFGNNAQANNNGVIKGFYIYGSVGRGKTFLMDLFCAHIGHTVLRLHFHHFMKTVHDELGRIKNQVDPLNLIAKQFATQHQIICLDEFMVTDITDAMLLYRLLTHLMDAGVVVITTTNIAPDDLYKNGLQRERFTPAIALIKARMTVHEIGSGQDFRRLRLDQHQRFFYPLSSEVATEMAQIFAELSENLTIQRDGAININSREIPFVAQSDEVIWFRFEALCEGYRSQLDYIELAKLFPIVMLSDIPVLDRFKEDAARRFLLLIDELYDRRIDLIVSSAVNIESIYTGNKIQFEFDRLQSRLFEMQSKDYGKS